MAYTLNDRPTAREIRDVLRYNAEPNEYQEIFDKLGLGDASALIVAHKERLEKAQEATTLRAIYQRANAESAVANEKFQTMTREISNAYKPPLLELPAVRWVDEEFFSHFVNMPEGYRTSLLKLNDPNTPLTGVDHQNIRAARSFFRYDDVAMEYMLDNPVRHVHGTSGALRHFANNEYTLYPDDAQKLCEVAVAYWQGQPLPGIITVRDYDYELVGYDNYIAVGCQNISRLDILRVAAAMGWAGYEKQTAPQQATEQSVGQRPDGITIDFWLDEKLLEYINPDARERVAALFTKLNAGGSVTTEERQLIEGIHVHTPLQYNRSPGEQEHIWSRLINLAYKRGSRWAGMAYSMNETTAQAVAEMVVKALQTGSGRERIGVSHPDASEAIFTTSSDHGVGVIMGCQFIAVEEVLRVAALEGWGGFVKQVGPAVVYKQPEAAPERPKLELPLQLGDKVLCRDGKERTVDHFGGGNDVLYLDDGSCVFTENGQVTRSTSTRSRDYDYEAVETVSRKSDPQFPLQVGDTVKLRNGGVSEVSKIDSSNVAWYNDPSNSYVQAACWANSGFSGNTNGSNPMGTDVVRILSRPSEEKSGIPFPLEVGDEVRTRDGRTGRCTKVGYDAIYFETTDGVEHCVFIKTGRGNAQQEREWDVVEITSRVGYAAPEAAKPDYPLQEGDIVRLSRSNTARYRVGGDVDGNGRVGLYMVHAGGRVATTVGTRVNPANGVSRSSGDWNVAEILERSKPTYPLQDGDTVKLENGSTGVIRMSQTRNGYSRKEGVTLVGVGYKQEGTGLYCYVDPADGQTDGTGTPGYDVVEIVARGQQVEQKQAEPAF